MTCAVHSGSTDLDHAPPDNVSTGESSQSQQVDSSEGAAAAVLLEALSCASYVVAFLQVFDRAPFRVGARVALSEEAFGAAVSLGGVGSLAVGGWLMRARRARSD